jgi:hypothetical protein
MRLVDSCRTSLCRLLMGQTTWLVQLHRSWLKIKWELCMFRYEIKYSHVCVIFADFLDVHVRL